jgi:5-(carboxyamino)imidazole ribonucleotide synthase
LHAEVLLAKIGNMIERIGIVGGGQLGRMLTEAAHPLGFQVTVLDSTPNCPAAQVGAKQIEGNIQDPQAIAQLVRGNDVSTWEIEHIYTRELRLLKMLGYNIQPDPETLETIQDKFFQKGFLRDNGLPVANFKLIPNDSFLQTAIKHLGDDLIIKSSRGGYDGRGNLDYSGESLEELHSALGSDIYAEQRVDFEREIAVVAARDAAGNIAVYPTVETVHKNNICHTVVAPAEVSPKVAQDTREIAHETLRHLGGAGVFAIEMFQTDDEVIINEIAPRVHNSGHLSIEANVTSQFEQHLRAITGMPLGSTQMRAPAAAMVNVLGKRNEPLSREGLQDVLALPDTHPHFYGKDPRPARKVGHITVLGASVEEVKERAQKAREALKI